MLHRIGLVFTLLVAGCTACQTSRPVPVTPTPTPSVVPPTPAVADAAPQPDAAKVDIYARACRNLRALHCPDGDPTPAGASCETVMRTVNGTGAATVAATCIAAAKSCADEARCVP
jgi:hypothetical protein